MSDNSLARLVEQCGHGKVGLECTLKRPTEAALMDSGIMLSKSSIELILRDARCNLRSDDKNCHVCWSGVEGASVACRAKVLAEMQRKDEWTEQVCGVSHFRANAEGSEMQMSCVGFWENH